MPRRKSLVTVTERLGKRYDRWKKSETSKNETKDEFFELAIAQEAAKPLATQTVAISPSLPRDEARAYLAKYYPRWTIKGEKETDGMVSGAVLEENPEFKTSTFVNPRDGRVYTRQVDNGPAMLDDERLREEDEYLWKRVTIDTPWGERVLWPLDKIPESLQTQLQKYIYHGTPKVKLAPVRKAKPEELSEA